MVPPVRKLIASREIFQNNRFINMSLAHTSWMPPYEHKYWTNFQTRPPPYWQETLREKITVKEFHVMGAKSVRGQA